MELVLCSRMKEEKRVIEAVEMVESETKYLKKMPACYVASTNAALLEEKMSKEYTGKKKQQQPAVCNICETTLLLL